MSKSFRLQNWGYIDTVIDSTFRTYLLKIYDPFEIDHDIVISHRFGGNVLL